MRFFVLMSRLRSDRQVNLFKNVLETTFLLPIHRVINSQGLEGRSIGGLPLSYLDKIKAPEPMSRGFPDYQIRLRLKPSAR